MRSRSIRCSVQELLRTLSEPQNAVLKQFEAMWAMQGVSVAISAEAQRCIAQEAQRRGTGARSLRSLLEELLLNAQFDAAEHPGCSIVLDEPGVLIAPLQCPASTTFSDARMTLKVRQS
jgi:ATP-dependent protease Clp ATPase subunit